MGLFAQSKEEKLYNRVIGILKKNNVQFETGTMSELCIYVVMQQFIQDTTLADFTLGFKKSSAFIRVFYPFTDAANSYVISDSFFQGTKKNPQSDIGILESGLSKLGIQLRYDQADPVNGITMREPSLTKDYPFQVWNSASDEALWNEIITFTKNIAVLSPELQKIHSTWEVSMLLFSMLL